MFEYYGQARKRAARRKSPWNLLLLAVCFGAAGFLWHAFFKAVWAFHTWIYPHHQFENFWNGNTVSLWLALSFLMLFGLAPAALILGFMLGNSLAWLVVPLRRIFDAEAEGHPGTGFQEIMRGLLKALLRIFPIRFVLAFGAAYFLKSLK